MPQHKETKNDGGSSESCSKYGPNIVIEGAINLKKGTLANPEIIDANAPFSLYFFQNKDRIIIGQKHAEIPDQPKITNQNTVLVGLNKATVNEIISAVIAKMRVVFLDNDVIFFVVIFGFIICW